MIEGEEKGKKKNPIQFQNVYGRDTNVEKNNIKQREMVLVIPFSTKILNILAQFQQDIIRMVVKY